MRIWVTRTAPDNLATATRLEALGHEALCIPVLGVLGADPEPSATSPDAIVFTSRNGVRHHVPDPALVGIPVFTVGHATADAATNAGYRDVRSADGDVEDLRLLILEQLSPPARLVHFGAREVAGDLKTALRRFGYLVEQRVVYASQAVPVRWLLEVRSDLPSLDGIVIHSPRAAERVARLLGGTAWRGKIWCISEACALKLAGVPGIELHFASRPNEAAMLEMIRRDRIVRMPCRAALRVAAVGKGRASPPALASFLNDNRPVSDDGDGPDRDPPAAA